MAIGKRRLKRYAYIAGTILALLVVLICIWNSTTKPAPHILLEAFNNTLLRNKNLKKILLWNNFFEEKHFRYDIGQAPFKDAKCQVDNCIIWDQQDGQSHIPPEEFDAVMFHALDRPPGSIKRRAPKIRSPHQRYIFFLLEAPATNSFNFRGLRDFFNWTITYRRDSDIYFPYGWVGDKSMLNDQLNPKPNITPTKWLKVQLDNASIERPWTLTSKTKMIAWFVSNCKTPSKRELYAAQLSKYVPVDVYGNCGKFVCPRKSQCLDMLEETYKFYLSFENSLCQDYVTEKLFLYMEYNVVPIVYGGADYKKVAPPMSYIDVNDYANPEELAKYLIYLDKNPQEYEKYFWWKAYYGVNRGIDHILCSLCEMLNDASLPRKSYDIQSWWNAPNICHSRTPPKT